MGEYVSLADIPGCINDVVCRRSSINDVKLSTNRSSVNLGEVMSRFRANIWLVLESPPRQRLSSDALDAPAFYPIDTFVVIVEHKDLVGCTSTQQLVELFLPGWSTISDRSVGLETFVQ